MKDILISLDAIDLRTLYANAFLLLLLALSIWNYAIGLRTKKATALREKIIILCKDWDTQNIAKIAMQTETSSFDWAWAQLPTTSDMVYSPKPLTLGFWLTKEALLKLTQK